MKAKGLTVKELIAELQSCRDQDATAYFCVEVDVKVGDEYRHDCVRLTIDEVADNVFGEVKMYHHDND